MARSLRAVDSAARTKERWVAALAALAALELLGMVREPRWIAEAQRRRPALRSALKDVAFAIHRLDRGVSDRGGPFMHGGRLDRAGSHFIVVEFAVGAGNCRVGFRARLHGRNRSGHRIVIVDKAVLTRDRRRQLRACRLG